MMYDLDKKDLQKFAADFSKMQGTNVIARTVQQHGVVSPSQDNAVLANLGRTFSEELSTGKVTNQKKSGRCWLFATLNTLRHDFEQKYNVEDFQFSQNYNSFYDRLEKANKFYEKIIELRNKPDDEREYLTFLKWGDYDGGQWANAAALIQKYGLVPQYVMPETFSSNQTSEFNELLNLKLKKDAAQIRKLAKNGTQELELRVFKLKKMSEVYKMLVYAFGQPPVSFDFEYRDKDKAYHLDQNLTPNAFFEKYVARDFEDYVCLTDAPDHEVGKRYGLEAQDYIYDAKHIEFLNVTTQELKDAAVAQLKDGEAVWFGCDVLQDMQREKGILAPEYFKKSELFGIDLELDKATRLATRQGEVSHAMTFTGVDIVDEKTTKWKVENSWSSKVGDEGYFIMSDKWFDEYMYEVIINKKYLTDQQKELLNLEIQDLKPWDSLA